MIASGAAGFFDLFQKMGARAGGGLLDPPAELANIGSLMMTPACLSGSVSRRRRVMSPLGAWPHQLSGVSARFRRRVLDPARQFSAKTGF